jgi:CheY-specific phosphatase CheX
MFRTETYKPHLNQIVADVMQVMYAASAEPTETSPLSCNEGFTASVGFVGDWRGALVVRCQSGTAEILTRRLLKTSNVSAEEVVDATGELANMIGGNLKSVLPAGVSLTVPVVVSGGGLMATICQGGESCSTVYTSEMGPFEVTLARAAEKQ